MNKTKNWITSFIIAGLLFAGLRPTLAQISKQEATLADYLISGDVEVGEETISGHRQIYFTFDKKRTLITKGNLNSRQPNSKGNYIAYVTDINGRGQIFLYNISTKSTIQLSNTGTNLEPKVTRTGEVVWEGWVDALSPSPAGWQVFYFDGKSVSQLTAGDLSLNPFIDEQYIAYGRKDINGDWRSVVYRKNDKKTVEVTIGETSKNPVVLESGKILLANEEFPLTADDLFLLDLAPLSQADPTPTPTPVPTSPETVTTEEILLELEVDLSGTTEATDSAGSVEP